MTNQKTNYLTEIKDLTQYIKVPLALFREKKLKKLSDTAKLLYVALLSRLSLSEKNNWRDENGRLYVFYTLQNAMEELSCCMETAVKIFAELGSEKGVGLIERKRRGFGKPCIIYFKNNDTIFNQNDDDSITAKNTDNEAAENLSTIYPQNNPQDIHSSELSDDINSQSVLPKTGSNTSKKPKKKFRENRSSDLEKTESNYIKKNYIKENYIEYNNNQSIYLADENEGSGTQKRNFYENLVKSNIGYDNFQSKIPLSRVDEFVAIMTDVLCTKDTHIKIGGKMLKTEDVKERFLKLDFEHLKYVYDSLQKVKTTVANPRAYIISSLYNSLDSAYLWGDITDR